MTFDLYTKALNGMTGGGQATNVSKGFFWTFIVLCIGAITGIFALIFSTFRKAPLPSADQDDETVEEGTLAVSAETITSIVFVSIGILCLTAGLIGGFTSNTGSGTFSRMSIGAGSLFQLIGLMIARKSNDLSTLDQTGYNITVCLILAQAIFGISGVPTIDTVYGSVNQVIQTAKTNIATGLTNAANKIAPASVGTLVKVPSNVTPSNDIPSDGIPLDGGRYSRKF
jgi:hypothetical protein